VVGDELSEVEASWLDEDTTYDGVRDERFESGERACPKFLLASFSERVKPLQSIPKEREELSFTASAATREPGKKYLAYLRTRGTGTE